jgi:hypothetical protein
MSAKTPSNAFSICVLVSISKVSIEDTTFLIEDLPKEVYSPVLDVRFSLRVVQARDAAGPECLCGQRDDVFFAHLTWLELWLDAILPFVFHDLSDPRLAQSSPFRPEATFAHVLKRLVNKDPAAQPTCKRDRR